MLAAKVADLKRRDEFHAIVIRDPKIRAKRERQAALAASRRETRRETSRQRWRAVDRRRAPSCEGVRMEPTKDADDIEPIADWSHKQLRVLKWDSDRFPDEDTTKKKRPRLAGLVAQGKARVLDDGRAILSVDSSPLSWPGPGDETCPVCGQAVAPRAHRGERITDAI